MLVATWGGTTYEWSDPVILWLGAGGLVAWVLFFLSQRRAAEPVIPLWLFRSRIFNLATLIGLIVVGVGMFAVIGYLPTYLQMVYGYSAMESGLLLIPMVVGIMATALPSRQLISRTDRYKIYPIVGTATSANNFFREIGATLGTAVVGAIFTNRLTDQLANTLPSQGAGDVDSLTPAMVQALPTELRDTVVAAYQHALVPIFAYLVPVFAIGLVLAFLLPEKKLADTNEPEPVAVHA